MMVRNVLVIRGGAIGDFILTLPIIEWLRRETSKLDLLVNRHFIPLHANESSNQTAQTEFRGAQALPGICAQSAVRGQLPRTAGWQPVLPGNGNFALDDADLAPFFVREADLPQRWRDYFCGRELVISYLHDPAGIFEANVRSCGVQQFVRAPHKIEPGSHATAQLAAPLTRLGIEVEDLAAKIIITGKECAAAKARLSLASPFIGIHPGSGGKRKNWPIRNWILLVENLLREKGPVVAVGGEADATELKQLRAHFGAQICYAINWPLRELAALLVGETFVGHDSGISHLAAAAGARSLILFGPTDPKVWAPQNADAKVLRAPNGDLAQLKIAQVGAALMRELKGTATGSLDSARDDDAVEL